MERGTAGGSGKKKGSGKAAKRILDESGVPIPPEVLAPIARRILRARHRQQNLSFGDWLPLAEPRLDWTAKHLVFLADKLDQVARGELRHLMISAPPRHAKSTLATILFPVFMLERNPAFRVVIGSHNAEKAGDFGRKARAVAERRRLPLDPRRQLATDWWTREAGVWRGVGRGNPPMGEGFGGAVLDDPLSSWYEANSRATRDHTWNWFLDMTTRLEPGAWEIVVMHRWHEDDPVGRALLAEDGKKWTVVNLTAIAEPGDILGRTAGEALWPERWPVAELEGKMRALPPSQREALFFGRPTTPQGHLLPVQSLVTVKLVDLPPGPAAEGETADERAKREAKKLRRCRAWDLAGTELERADYTVGALLAGPDDAGIVYVLDVVRGQWEFAERNRIMRATAERDGIETRILLPQDQKGALGREIVGNLKTVLKGFSVKARLPVGNKEARAEAFATAMGNKQIAIVEDASWPEFEDRGREVKGPAAIAIYVDELRAFPMSGRHDDQVDASVDAFGELAHGSQKMLWL